MNEKKDIICGRKINFDVDQPKTGWTENNLLFRRLDKRMQIFAICSFTDTLLIIVKEGVNEKKNVFFRALPESPKPPPWPEFGQLGPLFSEVEIQDLKISL